jgi:hypothetical protein
MDLLLLAIILVCKFLIGLVQDYLAERIINLAYLLKHERTFV